MQIPLPDFLHPVTAGAPVYCGTASGGGTPGRSLVLERGFHFVLCTGGQRADSRRSRHGRPEGWRAPLRSRQPGHRQRRQGEGRQGWRRRVEAPQRGTEAAAGRPAAALAQPHGDAAARRSARHAGVHLHRPRLLRHAARRTAPLQPAFGVSGRRPAAGRSARRDTIRGTAAHRIALSGSSGRERALRRSHPPPPLQPLPAPDGRSALPPPGQRPGIRQATQRNFPQLQASGRQELPHGPRHRLLCRAAPHLAHLPLADCEAGNGPHGQGPSGGAALRRCPAAAELLGPGHQGDCRYARLLRPVGLREVLRPADRLLAAPLPPRTGNALSPFSIPVGPPAALSSGPLPHLFTPPRRLSAPLPCIPFRLVVTRLTSPPKTKRARTTLGSCRLACSRVRCGGLRREGRRGPPRA